MARSRSFDEDAVLSAAMQAFRRKGYQAVSIRDLEHATQLKAGSIYNSFGDKSGLFDAAFAHYNKQVLQGRLKRYAPPQSGLKGLRELFRSLLAEPDGGHFGCLITNSAVEFGANETAHPSVQQAFETLRRTFEARLTEAQDAGALASGIKPPAAALRFLALYQGVLVLVRGGYRTQALEYLIDEEFNYLEDPS